MEIMSANNPLVKQWAQLLDKKGREQQGKFIVEGIHLVKEALLSNNKIDCIAYSIERGLPMELAALAGDCKRIIVSEAVIAKCADTQSPQGVFAVLDKPAWNAERIVQQHASLVVAIDGVQDPGNLGTIIRSADAVGASGVLIGAGSVDLYNPKGIRATMGSLFHLPIAEADLSVALPQARERGVQLVSTSLQATKSCYELDLTRDTWLIVGNEGKGVSSQAAAFVSETVIIPMRGGAESLNVAMAATVLLFEALRQRLNNTF